MREGRVEWSERYRKRELRRLLAKLCVIERDHVACLDQFIDRYGARGDCVDDREAHRAILASRVFHNKSLEQVTKCLDEENVINSNEILKVLETRFILVHSHPAVTLTAIMQRYQDCLKFELDRAIFGKRLPQRLSLHKISLPREQFAAEIVDKPPQFAQELRELLRLMGRESKCHEAIVAAIERCMIRVRRNLHQQPAARFYYQLDTIREIAERVRFTQMVVSRNSRSRSRAVLASYFRAHLNSAVEVHCPKLASKIQVFEAMEQLSDQSLIHEGPIFWNGPVFHCDQNGYGLLFEKVFVIIKQKKAASRFESCPFFWTFGALIELRRCKSVERGKLYNRRGFQMKIEEQTESAESGCPPVGYRFWFRRAADMQLWYTLIFHAIGAQKESDVIKLPLNLNQFGFNHSKYVN